MAAPASAQDRSGTPAAQDRQAQHAPSTPAAPSTPSTQTASPQSGDPTDKTDPAASASARSAAIAAKIAEAGKFAEFDKLKAQGQTSDLPGTYDSLLQDTGGWRSWLADHDLYIKGQNLTSLAYDLGGGRSPTSPQMFNGQKPTVSNDLESRISWKVAGDGSDIGQFNASLHVVRTNWQQVGPDFVGVDRLDYYQSFFNRKIEVTAGIGANIVNFLGIFSGGNLLLANGLAATIPLEVGLSGGAAVTPLFNVQFNGKGGLYSKTGIQRSIRPEGAILEAMTSHGGLKFSQPGARVLLIQEVGLLRPASSDGRQIWLRAGGIYNTTEYQRLDGLGTRKNWAAYVLADYQVIKPSRQEAYRGIFVGASALVAPGSLNVFKQTYEARAYAVGMIPGRPTDALNFTVDYNLFSHTGGETYRALGLVTQRYQFSAGVLYAIHARRGVYVTPSFTYVRHPSFTGDFKPAATVSSSLTFLL